MQTAHASHDEGRPGSARPRFAMRTRTRADSSGSHPSVDEVPQPFGDVVECELGPGNRHHQRVDVIVGSRCDAVVVDLEEDRDREPAEPLVAIDEGMIPDDGLQKSSRLEPHRRIGIFAPDGGLRSRYGRGEQADVANWWWFAQQESRQVDEIVEVEELDGTLNGQVDRSRRRVRR
jgi:hypothetical protein